jgi:uncharacterized membrane protein
MNRVIAVIAFVPLLCDMRCALVKRPNAALCLLLCLPFNLNGIVARVMPPAAKLFAGPASAKDCHCCAALR